MFVSFLSLDDEKNKVFFQSEAFQQKNEIWFEDKSTLNTKIKITSLEDSMILERMGSVEMYLHFTLDKPTVGRYKNSDGLILEFLVHTKVLQQQKNKIRVQYEMIMNGECISRHIFQLTFFEK